MSKPRRIYSIDIFRGMTIALMIIVNNPGSWAHIYAPFRHAKWHGCTLTDLVFPFFLLLLSGGTLSPPKILLNMFFGGQCPYSWLAALSTPTPSYNKTGTGAVFESWAFCKESH